MQQAAADDSQQFTVSSALPASPLDRQSYAATSQEEIHQKKAREAAAAAAAAARAARPATTFAAERAVPVLAAGSGVVRWPLTSTFRVTDQFGARGGAHMGTDMVTAGGTPIYASVAGTVDVSSESYGAYGVAVTVESVVNGQRIRAVYPHMQYNTRQVGSGQEVQAGQLLGLVGSTGRSTANHLHFEVSVNDVTVDSLAWLEANAQ
ncbi:Murein DD-endopeptidase MepM and murein hydrolase activator NlpD, containing LysM domain [Microbacterium hydrothermale]|nr:Murein DD-endopeptidase MepM and murein hydrolase activator NlpD, containing LysM domain [Microbacterium hydrothermale]